MSFEALLVEGKQSDELTKTLRVRGSNRFQEGTYTDLISDSRRRYKKYLEAVGKE